MEFFRNLWVDWVLVPDRMNQCKRSSFARLDLSGLGLTTLPDLPPDVYELDLRDNKLKQIKSLPPNLVYLYLENNELESLPELPETLQILILSKNRLKQLPVLPPSLGHLRVDRNELTSLPYLPSSLTYLAVSHNPFPYFIKTFWYEKALKDDTIAFWSPLTNTDIGNLQQILNGWNELYDYQERIRMRVYLCLFRHLA